MQTSKQRQQRHQMQNDEELGMGTVDRRTLRYLQALPLEEALQLVVATSGDVPRWAENYFMEGFDEVLDEMADKEREEEEEEIEEMEEEEEEEEEEEVEEKVEVEEEGASLPAEVLEMIANAVVEENSLFSLHQVCHFLNSITGGRVERKRNEHLQNVMAVLKRLKLPHALRIVLQQAGKERYLAAFLKVHETFCRGTLQVFPDISSSRFAPNFFVVESARFEDERGKEIELECDDIGEGHFVDDRIQLEEGIRSVNNLPASLNIEIYSEDEDDY